MLHGKMIRVEAWSPRREKSRSPRNPVQSSSSSHTWQELSHRKEWVCSCGFKNRAENIRCGGNGALGCHKPRITLKAKAAVRPPPPPPPPRHASGVEWASPCDSERRYHPRDKHRQPFTKREFIQFAYDNGEDKEYGEKMWSEAKPVQ